MARLIAAVCLLARLAPGAAPFLDRTHPSKVFGTDRHYRIFLPPGYEESGRRYPVIYYFHGHSDRYTLERYDGGKDTVPKIARFTASRDAIVVSVDGYVARDYTGFYGGSPWDVREDGGGFDFGLYFRELAAHVDASYRTLTSRRFRATSGLSMGGFMSLWLSARFPDFIGSASSFNPGPEFYAGDPQRRVLWRPKDHTANHEQTIIRLIRASGDYISQYHDLTRDAYARHSAVDFEYRQDEYHRHWATSIEETFDFHMRAFGRSELDNVPEVFSHANPYRKFEVWGYGVEVDAAAPAVVSLEQVRQGGLRIRTRAWAPDGPPAAANVSVITAPVYQPGATYRVFDYSIAKGRTQETTRAADAQGRLRVIVDGTGHQIGFAGPGTGAHPPVLLPVTDGDYLRVRPGQRIDLPVRIFNPRGEAMTQVTAELSSAYPTVEIVQRRAALAGIAPGQAAAAALAVRFTAGAGYFARTRLTLKLTFDGWHSVSENIDVMVAPEVLPKAAAVEVLDGRTVTLHVFRQKGNQGGGAPVAREIREGKGNGNGVLEPGEEATIWFRLDQGMDPFDKQTWRRAKVYSDSPHVRETASIDEGKQLEWTGAKERTSLIRLAPDAPRGAPVRLILDGESWSYHWTPDVRYGPEPLYQAFQLHTHHLVSWDLIP